MKKKKKNSTVLPMQNELTTIQKEYLTEIDANPEYSLIADPTGALGLTDMEKDFIRHYVNFKSVATAAELACIDADTAKIIFTKYDIQKEIRRIYRALYHRQFASKLVSIDDIGGYLSSLLTGENVPIADQLKTSEKLRVIELLLRLNEMKANALNNPGDIAHKDLEIQIKNLSITAIQQLISQNNSINEKNNVIGKLDDGTLSVEEKAYLSTLPVEDLFALLEETKGGQQS